MKICHYNNNQAGVVVGNKVINFGDALIKAGLARTELHDARNHRRSGEQPGGDADRARCGEQRSAART